MLGTEASASVLLPSRVQSHSFPLLLPFLSYFLSSLSLSRFPLSIQILDYHMYIGLVEFHIHHPSYKESFSIPFHLRARFSLGDRPMDLLDTRSRPIFPSPSLDDSHLAARLATA